MTEELTEALTEEQLYTACRRMETMGGHFAEAIAKAFYAADSTNRAKLVAAFEDMFRRYAHWGE